MVVEIEKNCDIYVYNYVYLLYFQLLLNLSLIPIPIIRVVEIVCIKILIFANCLLDLCCTGKAFASEHSVKEHQIVHRDTRNHICKHCPKTFKTSSALKAHEAIHSNVKSYKCSVCGKG